MLSHRSDINDGETLRAARLARGITREELAVVAGVAGLDRVARIERGDVQPHRGTMRLLDIALAHTRETGP